MMVWLKPWPMCSVPVTLGGGSRMQKASRFGGLCGVETGGEITPDSQSDTSDVRCPAGSKLWRVPWPWEKRKTANYTGGGPDGAELRAVFGRAVVFRPRGRRGSLLDSGKVRRQATLSTH